MWREQTELDRYLKKLSHLVTMFSEFHESVTNKQRHELSKGEQLAVSKGLAKHLNVIHGELQKNINNLEYRLDMCKTEFDSALKASDEKIKHLEAEIEELEMSGYAWK